MVRKRETSAHDSCVEQILGKCARLAVGNFYFCMNSLSGAVMVCLVVLKLWQFVLKLVASCGENRLKYPCANSHFMIRQL